MDMSFTKDPQWIREREALWKSLVKDYSLAEETSKKRLNMLHMYFMTGDLQDGHSLRVNDRLFFFPAPNLKGFEHVLKHNMPENPTNDDINDIAWFFRQSVKQAPGVSEEMALEIFRFAFGSTYHPDWQVPFVIGDENEKRWTKLDPHPAFSSGATLVNWLQFPDHPPSMWLHLMDYWFSLFPHLNPIVFQIGKRSRQGVPGISLRLIHGKIKDFLGICAHQLDCTNGAPEGQERRDFMRDIYDRMEALDGPAELLRLWQKVKDADPEEFKPPR